MADADDRGVDDEKSSGGFRAFWSSLPGVLTGIAAVITAAIALAGLWRSQDDGGETASSPPAEVGATTVATTTDATATAAGGVLAEGRLTLRDDEAANLRAKRVTNVGNSDIWLMGGGNPDFAVLYAPYGGLVTEAPSADDKAGCVAALNARSADRLQLAELAPRSVICLKTQTGAIAALRIVEAPAIGSPELVIDYTLWS